MSDNQLGDQSGSSSVTPHSILLDALVVRTQAQFEVNNAVPHQEAAPLVLIASVLMLSSIILDLRLIGFEASQSSARCCRLGNPVAAANPFELAFTNNFHRHPDLPIICSLSRAAQRTEVHCKYP